MTTALTVKQSTEAIDYADREVIDLLKQTVAKGTTDLELKLFIERIKATGLNAFKKEIWCIVVPAKPANGNYRGRDREVQMMTGINGFYQIANSDPSYDGLEHGLVGPNGEFLSLGYPKDDYIGAWTRVYIKGRRMPQEEVAFLKEYAKDYGNWKSMRRIMIVKCSDSLSLRKALPQKLNGLYTAEEMPPEYSQTVEVMQPKPLASVPGLKTADTLQQEAAAKVFGDDDISTAQAAKKPERGLYHYDLKSYFEGMDVSKANKITRKLEDKHGLEMDNGLWAIPEYIDGLKDFIVSDTVEAA